MKFLVGLLLCLLFQNSYAKETLIEDCRHLENATEADFVLFSKKEFIQLGECLAVSFIKKRIELDLIESCNEVDEDKRNFLGVLSLSKLEAIKIGQCIGVINFIYQHYDNEPVNSWGSYKYKTYHCLKGNRAVDRIIRSRATLLNKQDIRKLLCEVY
ncbi:hypothetical protein Q4530_01105 [Colwellia sp. 1_MG-2023]|jgi:hypothetical protein|uniref:hypothetical protein n=1 Tax=unclassified Colwellia TaxID=196834 RepID=UPI001C091F84|nr:MULTISPECIES: hypothetical protein [unclassified Colwellia]MBU2925808.1 hypothetical protein [Colwellia sp. C2M11]MDO6650965.1 hypothetical protein [Colwellia sp. 3_MG-2023]MDO6664000.1 hypothetical protein [Colwellia sp. 2_MG-2023]MDO6688351.1 hypothetical protein [Colwellia sp. 1_MG-2023]